MSDCRRGGENQHACLHTNMSRTQSQQPRTQSRTGVHNKNPALTSKLLTYICLILFAYLITGFFNYKVDFEFSCTIAIKLNITFELSY